MLFDNSSSNAYKPSPPLSKDYVLTSTLGMSMWVIATATSSPTSEPHSNLTNPPSSNYSREIVGISVGSVLGVIILAVVFTLLLRQFHVSRSSAHLCLPCSISRKRQLVAQSDPDISNAEQAGVVEKSAVELSPETAPSELQGCHDKKAVEMYEADSRPVSPSPNPSKGSPRSTGGRGSPGISVGSYYTPSISTVEEGTYWGGGGAQRSPKSGLGLLKVPARLGGEIVEELEAEGIARVGREEKTGSAADVDETRH